MYLVYVTLPYYVNEFASDFTVHLTPTYNGRIRILNSSEVENNKFIVYGEPGPFSWIVHAKRADINVEPSKNNVKLYEVGPYKWLGN